MLRTAEAIPIAGVASSVPALTAAGTFFGAGGYRSLLGCVAEASAVVPALIAVGPPGRVGFGVQPDVVVRTSKGMAALRHLVVNQHRVVSAAELAVVVEGGDAARIAAVQPTVWTSGGDEAELEAVGASDTIRAVLFDEATRSRVTKLLRRTIVQLADSHQLIAAHLDASIVTGHGCRYRPVGAAVQWSVE